MTSGTPDSVLRVSTALYRRYRPDRFEDVIGQDHVTVPLRTALSKDRVNHAYLFSGPRGCGKTTSARILARCLNCAQGPTSTPCGECDSCRDLATGGPGSLDVLEIDAASHGGVEDARGLRERATFAPVRDRYKILIIDEAHMVTSAGFNALLKIVEEPPEHLKFIFATTEPDKVIGTIRSRTHHYPFRLVPPEPLIAYLEQLCASEQTQVDPGVLPLVVRAGTGSVRDTLSVLDQLIAGAAEGRVDYDLAVNLLGFTPEALLDDVIDALTADDSQTVFKAVDRVVQSGQDPRRFVEDLLDRFRDLVIARAMPDQASAVLHGVPEDQVRRLAAQAAQLSRAELSRLADITNEALSEMVGATSPRLHLELLMARLLLPASDDTHRGLSARLEALERRLAYAGGSLPDDGPAPSQPASPAADAAAAGRTPDGAARSAEAAGDGADGGGGVAAAAGLSGAALARAAMRRQDTAPGGQGAPAAEQAPAAQQVQEAPQVSQRPQAPTAPQAEAPTAEAPPTQGSPAEAPQTPPTEAPSTQGPQSEAPPVETPGAPDAAEGTDSSTPASEQPPSGGQATNSVEMVRRAWPDILAALEDSSRLVWMLVKDNASVAGFDGRLLTVGFTQDGPRRSLLNRRGDQVLAEAVHRVLGIRPELDLILGGDGPQGDRHPKAEGRPSPAAGPVNGGTPQNPGPQPAQDSAPMVPQQPERPSPQHPERPRPQTPQAERPAPQPPQPERPAPPEHEQRQRPANRETTPPPAPSPDAWGTPQDTAPDWGGPSESPGDDPWADIPEFDPDSDMEDSAGPEGWSPEDTGSEAEQTFGASGSSAPAAPAADAADDADDDTTADEHRQDRQDRQDPQALEDASASVQGGKVDPSAESSAPQGTDPAGPSSSAEGSPVPAYDPGPLVPEVEHSIPVFARPESELRAEFAARFGNLRPQGFDRSAEDDPRPNASAADSEGPSSRRPSSDDSPDPGVPAPDHDDSSATQETGVPGLPGKDSAGSPSGERPTGARSAREVAFAEAAAGNDPKALAERGGGHPASWFGALMQRMAEGGSADPPVNEGSGGPGGVPGSGAPGGPGAADPSQGGRPSAADLSRPRGGEAGGGEEPSSGSERPALDPRAAAVQAARDAARGRAPRPEPTTPPAEAKPSVSWEDEVASDDDISLEESGLVGRAVVERILGARLIEEQPNS